MNVNAETHIGAGTKEEEKSEGERKNTFKNNGN